MISFAPAEDQVLAQATLDALARETLRPLAARMDEAGAMSDDALAILWDTGLVPLALGAPRSRTTSCIALEALGWADASMALALAAPMGFVQAITDFGSDEQKTQTRRAYGGAQFANAAVLVQEPSFAFDPGALQTRCTRTSDGYSVSGVKALVPRATAARDYLVIARGEDELAALVVPADAPGVTIEAPRGALGLRALAPAEVRFDAALVPASARLDVDPRMLMASARVATGAILTGVAQAVLDFLIPHVKARVAHGAALGRKQSVAFRLADMATQIPSMRWMCWRAAATLEKGGDARRAARLAQLHCAEQALWITDEGVQLMGGHGYMRDNPVERWYRDVRTLASLEGVGGV